MRYRWGFIENGAFEECQPIVEDKTSLDYSQQSGEVFYRAKLNGTLSFRLEFDAIVNAGYNVEHIVVLQYFDESQNDWTECWRGRFTLTDCEIDFDTNTISVQPETLDRYTEIEKHYEDEYNIVKIEPDMHQVYIGVRPCLQIYHRNDNKLTNIIDKQFWEVDSDEIFDQLHNTYHFRRIGEFNVFYIKAQFPNFGAVAEGILIGERDGWNNWFQITGYAVDPSDNQKKSVQLWCDPSHPAGSDETGRFAIYSEESLHSTLYGTLEFEAAGFVPTIFQAGTAEELDGQWTQIYARLLFNSDQATISWGGETLTLYSFPAEDLAARSKNYNKIAEVPEEWFAVAGSVTTQTTATQWGQNLLNDYFVKYTQGTRYYMPTAISKWRYASAWIAVLNNNIFNISKTLTIKDCYHVTSIIEKLIEKAGLSLPLQSIVLTTDQVASTLNFAAYLMVTQRSNVISNFYNQPAQNAPATLQNFTSLLKKLFNIYWHIGADGKIHFEHISFYDNGYTYSDDAPEVLIDAETKIHTNTKENKVFGQNKVKFEKTEMPDQITFSFDDQQTLPYDGLPMKAIDKYVSEGNKDERALSRFDTDIDMILASPDNVSKDGFVLFGCPYLSGLHYPYFSVAFLHSETIKDEDGITTTYRFQNGYVAVSFLQTNLLKYHLPCENWMINGMADVAVSMGNYKTQTVEFADTELVEIFKDVDNCNKIIRTQQGDGHIKTISINLNSLAAKADLLFNFIGRVYWLKGTALGNSITISINGESKTISVSANAFKYRYQEPISALSFAGTDVVSVDFANCDRFDNLTSANAMFDGCDELLAVDFGGKKFGAVTTAQNMFRGCSALTTLICPDTSTWKADLDFSDCPALTDASLVDLLGFLYYFNSGTHKIKPNTTMWQSLTPTRRNELIAAFEDKGWTMDVPANYFISGHSTASVVYATINGHNREFDVSGGAFNFGYFFPITSITIEDSNVTDIDFSLSDGLSGVTSLNNGFKNCSSLTSIDFTDCDLSNVATASDCFAGCSSLTTLTIPAGTWKPDIDLFASAMQKTDMLATINGLYTYADGTHTITFNSTIWQTLPYADQSQVSTAAAAKEWQTNEVATVYVISGTSTNINGTETFTIRFINDGAMHPSAAETITANVDANGDWSYCYRYKQIYSMQNFAASNTTIKSVFFSEGMVKLTSLYGAFKHCANIENIDLNSATLENLTSASEMCLNCTSLQSIDLSSATFENANDIPYMFSNCTSLQSVDLSSATFENLTSTREMFNLCSSLQSIDLSSATFQNVINAQSMFRYCSSLQSIDLSSATFANVTTVREMFKKNISIQSIDLSKSTFKKVTTTREMMVDCTSLQSVDLSSATFENARDAQSMFYSCKNLTMIKWSNNLNFGLLEIAGDTGTANIGMFQGCEKLTSASLAALNTQTFASLQGARGMFDGCKSLTTIDLSAATFTNLISAQLIFRNCSSLQSIDLNSATFDSLVVAQSMFNNDSALTNIDMSSATFNNVINTTTLFNANTSLTTLIVPELPTAIEPSSTAAMDIGFSTRLSYTSMLKVAKWLCDRTGYTAQNCRFSATAWNAALAQEGQAAMDLIDSILSAKNWNRTLATP